MAGVTISRTIAAVLCLLTLLLTATAEIHRAKHTGKTLLYEHGTQRSPEQTDDIVTDEDEDEDENSWWWQGRHRWGKSEAWVCSLCASVLVGLCGIFPLLIIPLEAGPSLKHGAGAAKLKLLLSFAVGGLLGDVFLHLLPEAWGHVGTDANGHVTIGLWVITGILSFILMEKIFAQDTNEDDHTDQKLTNQYVNHNNNNNNVKTKAKQKRWRANSKVHVANGITKDVHCHQVVGSRSSGSDTDAELTSLAASKSRDHCLHASPVKMFTAMGGMLGAVVALSVESAEGLGNRTAWILPFTAGGFINIALVNVLPDLLTETNPRESVKQIACLGGGIAVMALVTTVVD
ncbi:PREDICTED: zinc transporter ZIP13-like [Priapulus caudatus]|uniref:Zinc transporter ZIP13-like n=1 Tax=Priapulus caudatus TaxID=37621 RepID=A0ABM1E5S9_PRICU|nr:PREDICTED: zinc transporter ZIP13-like [Priapulus caudatus]